MMNILRVLILMVVAGWSNLQQHSAVAADSREHSDYGDLREAIIKANATSPDELALISMDIPPAQFDLAMAMEWFITRWRFFRSFVGDHFSAIDCFDTLGKLRHYDLTSAFTVQALSIPFRDLPQNVDPLLSGVSDSELDRYAILGRLEEQFGPFIPNDRPETQKTLFFRYICAGLSLQPDNNLATEQRISALFDVFNQLQKAHDQALAPN
ncbi:MAG: hypothetical protein LBC25_01165 [Holosporales bacterium]|nr:hypothetical protein [Holosporales bacterium]